MIIRYSCSVNANPANRVGFFYWDDMIEYLRNEVEADGNTYRMNITNWVQSRGQRKTSKASCQLTWVRINQETKMAETVSCTVTCEDINILPHTVCYYGENNDKQYIKLGKSEWVEKKG